MHKTILKIKMNKQCSLINQEQRQMDKSGCTIHSAREYEDQFYKVMDKLKECQNRNCNELFIVAMDQYVHMWFSFMQNTLM